MSKSTSIPANTPKSKKYLLYIHAPEFANEPHKSELVNALLKEHYKHNWISEKFDAVYTFSPHAPQGVYTTRLEPETIVYTCCQNRRKMCEHWRSDGFEYINSVTGERFDPTASQ